MAGRMVEEHPHGLGPKGVFSKFLDEGVWHTFTKPYPISDQKCNIYCPINANLTEKFPNSDLELHLFFLQIFERGFKCRRYYIDFLRLQVHVTKWNIVGGALA